MKCFLYVMCVLFIESVQLIHCQNVFTNNISDEIVINKVVDEFLKYVRIAIRDEGVDRISVPNLNVQFVGPLGIKGTFNGSDGSAAYLSSVYRTGDAKLVYGKSLMTLSLDLGLEQLTVDYNSYQAKILSIGPTGRMRATVGKNSLYVTIFFYYNFLRCSEDVGIVDLNEFNNIDVRLTGLDPLNWLLDDIASWIASDFRDNIKYLIEDNIRSAIKTAMVKYNLCKYLPHLPKY